MKRFTLLTSLILAVALGNVWARAEAPDLHEQVVTLPVTVGKKALDMYVTVFRPNGKGPFPLVVINHGRAGDAQKRAQPKYWRFESAARFFVRKGFLVLVPTRIGYGATGQEFDPEYSGPEKRQDYRSVLEAATSEVLAAIDYGRALPDVDPGRIVLIGQSVGGFTTTGTAAKNPSGVVTAINFAGGAGGDPDKHPGTPADAGQMQAIYKELGKACHIPMLWVYTENDKYFDAEHSQAWAKGYSQSGGQLDYRLLPAFHENGHLLFEDGCDLWMPVVDAYLAQYGFKQPGVMALPPPSHFAGLEEVDKLPHAGASAKEGYQKFLQAAPPRAFVLSSNGQHFGWAHGDDALSKALANCRRNDSEGECRLYAVDSDVVW